MVTVISADLDGLLRDVATTVNVPIGVFTSTVITPVVGFTETPFTGVCKDQVTASPTNGLPFPSFTTAE
ncbi:hypothetical protein DV702_08815 [Sporosarcina sp. PTS2304]|nr:hypothetical protein DV702_08815 [Sporosarcina sp. PTS2304]